MMQIPIYGLDETALRDWAEKSGVEPEAFLRQILRELRTAGMVVLPEKLKARKT